jgi:GTP-binding protein
MPVASAEFVKSSDGHETCPPAKHPEYAFIGRSNVGKSSLINALTNKKKLAKTSGRPGKTQLINHFIINKEKSPWYLVDLPGYGFASAPIKEKEKWLRFIRAYLINRENLMCVMLLLDIRHSAQKVDLEFMRWLGEKGLPFVMVFTKSDKITPSKLPAMVEAYKERMLEEWDDLPQVFLTSAENFEGREEVLTFIEKTNGMFEAY